MHKPLLPWSCRYLALQIPGNVCTLLLFHRLQRSVSPSNQYWVQGLGMAAPGGKGGWFNAPTSSMFLWGWNCPQLLGSKRGSVGNLAQSIQVSWPLSSQTLEQLGSCLQTWVSHLSSEVKFCWEKTSYGKCPGMALLWIFWGHLHRLCCSSRNVVCSNMCCKLISQ